MNEAYQSMTHSKWDCKYHLVFVPKRRRKVMYGEVRRNLGAIFHELARQKPGSLTPFAMVEPFQQVAVSVFQKGLSLSGRHWSIQKAACHRLSIEF